MATFTESWNAIVLYCIEKDLADKESIPTLTPGHLEDLGISQADFAEHYYPAATKVAQAVRAEHDAEAHPNIHVSADLTRQVKAAVVVVPDTTVASAPITVLRLLISTFTPKKVKEFFKDPSSQLGLLRKFPLYEKDTDKIRDATAGETIDDKVLNHDTFNKYFVPTANRILDILSVPKPDVYALLRFVTNLPSQTVKYFAESKLYDTSPETLPELTDELEALIQHPQFANITFATTVCMFNATMCNLASETAIPLSDEQLTQLSVRRETFDQVVRPIVVDAINMLGSMDASQSTDAFVSTNGTLISYSGMNLSHDSINLAAPTIEVSDSSINAVKVVVFAADDFYCSNSTITAPNIYLPAAGHVHSICDLVGTVHYAELPAV